MSASVLFDGCTVKSRDAGAISLPSASRCASSLAAIRGTRHERVAQIKNRTGVGNATRKPCFTRFARIECQAIQSQQSEPESEACSRSFLGMIIEKALQAYLRTQLENCRELKILVKGNNQELISGQVRSVRVVAKGAVYKGFSLTAVDLQSSPLKFRFDINKPLLHPFNVNASISIREEDLNFSLSSPLLSSAVSEVLPRDSNDRQGLPKLAVREGYVQVQQWQPQLSVNLCVELKDRGKSLQVTSLRSGAGKLDAVERQFDMTGVQITQLDIGKKLISVTGDFTVTP